MNELAVSGCGKETLGVSGGEAGGRPVQAVRVKPWRRPVIEGTRIICMKMERVRGSKVSCQISGAIQPEEWRMRRVAELEEA